jgi:predicted TPR repeat methyltransferase
VNYERDTKNAYRNEEKATAYLEQYTKGTKWARFSMWRQRVLIKNFLDHCRLTAADRLLDIPCGTGYIGQTIQHTPASLIGADISLEMMDRAGGEYGEDQFHGFVQADITATPFLRGSFTCIVVLALMHRLQKGLRQDVLSEVADLSSRFVIMSYSVDSFPQRMKERVLKILRPSHIPAPSSMRLRDIRREVTSHGFKLLRISSVAYFLSAKVVLLMEKDTERGVENP